MRQLSSAQYDCEWCGLRVLHVGSEATVVCCEGCLCSRSWELAKNYCRANITLMNERYSRGALGSRSIHHWPEYGIDATSAKDLLFHWVLTTARWKVWMRSILEWSGSSAVRLEEKPSEAKCYTPVTPQKSMQEANSR